MKMSSVVTWIILAVITCYAALGSADTDICGTMQFNSVNINADSSCEIANSIYQDARAKLLKPSVLQMALNAYKQSRQKGIRVHKPIITIIDYSLSSSQKRLWVIDLTKGKIMFNSLVAHGKNSGSRSHAVKFSNKEGSLQTSLGVFLTSNTYFGHDGYSLNLKGLEQGFNDNALKRHIVMHGSPYVSKKTVYKTGCVGCSHGCPAVEPQLAKEIINAIKGGSLIFAYYPDATYLSHSSFLNS